MTTRSALKAEEYSRLASRAMTTFVLVSHVNDRLRYPP